MGPAAGRDPALEAHPTLAAEAMGCRMRLAEGLEKTLAALVGSPV
jgi:hypothetical protein